MDNKEVKEDSKRPEDSHFKQQRLRAWQPLLTPPWVIATFVIVGIIFIPIGVVIFLASRDVVELSQRYDNSCTYGTACAVTMTVTKDMKSPVYVYYQLTNFYQNHRRYVRSRSDPQLSGDSLSDTSTCDPLEKNDGKVLYPCGLIANSFFNDTLSDTTPSTWINQDSNWKFWRTPSGGAQVEVKLIDTGIAWSSDVSKKFKDAGVGSSDSSVLNQPGMTRNSTFTYDVNGQKGNYLLPRVDNEHFIVWMRTAGLPTFKKLWARIETDLKEGDTLLFKVSNNFRVSSFNGEKALVLSTTSWIGGKNDFLGVAYMAVGAFCIVLALIFLVKCQLSPRELGNMAYLNPGKSNN